MPRAGFGRRRQAVEHQSGSTSRMTRGSTTSLVRRDGSDRGSRQGMFEQASNEHDDDENDIDHDSDGFDSDGDGDSDYA